MSNSHATICRIYFGTNDGNNQRPELLFCGFVPLSPYSIKIGFDGSRAAPRVTDRLNTKHHVTRQRVSLVQTSRLDSGREG